MADQSKQSQARRLIAAGWSVRSACQLLKVSAADLREPAPAEDRRRRESLSFVRRQLKSYVVEPRVLHANFGDLLTREECGL